MSMKEKFKKFVSEHKTGIKVTLLGLVATGVGGYLWKLNNDQKKIETEEIENYIEEEENLGRDCLIPYSDENTEEVLCKERCYESFVNDTKQDGMQYKEVRELNGIKDEET